MSYLFISHDLSVIEHLCTRIAIMCLGNIVEFADRDELFNNPLHPDPTIKRKQIILTGEMPNPEDPPSGCKFHTRCLFVTVKCKEIDPEFREITKGHEIACHLASIIKI